MNTITPREEQSCPYTDAIPPPARTPSNTNPSVSLTYPSPDTAASVKIESSKGKKWTEKLSNKFQKSKKISASQSMSNLNLKDTAFKISSISDTSLPRSASLTSDNDSNDYRHPFPLRFSSIPRPHSQVLARGLSPETPRKHTTQEPPKVTPFGYPKSKQPIKKSFLRETCCLCEEPVSNKTKLEKIVPLKCGHLVHEECLLAFFEGNYRQGDIHKMFPQCTKCKSDNSCIPVDENLKDKLISQFLINGGGISIQENSTDKSLKNSSKALSYTSNLTRAGKSTVLTSSDKNYKDLSIDIVPINYQRSVGRPVHRFTRGSVISALPSTVSSVSRNSPTSNTLYCQENIPLPLLRSHFIQLLLINFSNRLDAWEIDSKFGLLRLVDKLMFSEDGKTYRQCCCFLFESSLLVATIEDTNKTDSFIDTKFTDYIVYSFDNDHTKVKIDTLESSVLKCTLLNNVGRVLAQQLTFYMTEQLNSNSSKIVEKWISGILNRDLNFKSDTFTSSLALPLMVRDMSANSTSIRASNKSSTPNPSTIVGLPQSSTDWNNENRPIVRRSVIVPNENDGSTIRTTITSILSIKRERPADLVVVMQLSFRKISGSDAVVLLNTLKALILKFKNAKCCFVDSMGGVVQLGTLEKSIGMLASTEHFKDDPSRTTFDPEWLKEQFYASSCEDVGLLVISNTTMEIQKSCLFMDYKSFACIGRRRPNELKVRVGYLNVDYSDRIFELVEIGTWNDLLETVCYSFNMNFEDDDEWNSDGYDCYDDEDESFERSIDGYRNSTLPLNCYSETSTIKDISPSKSTATAQHSATYTLNGECDGILFEHANSNDSGISQCSSGISDGSDERSMFELLPVYPEISSRNLRSDQSSTTWVSLLEDIENLIDKSHTDQDEELTNNPPQRPSSHSGINPQRSS